MDWQPIETAPKDREIMLLKWRGSYAESDVDFGCWGFLETSDIDGRDIYDWLSNTGLDEVTHWMPLPEPPK